MAGHLHLLRCKCPHTIENLTDPDFGNIARGEFTPVLRKHSKSFFANRLHLSGCRSDAAPLHVLTTGQ